jgi:hypothetical protein
LSKTGLIESARALAEASPRAARAFEGVVDACAADLTRSMKLVPELENIIGEGNLDVMETNHGNHFRYMCSASALFDPTSFVETVLWVLRAYRARGFSVRYWNVMLPKALETLRAHLGPSDYEEIRPFYEWLLDSMPAFVRLSETELSAYEQMGGAHGLHD